MVILLQELAAEKKIERQFLHEFVFERVREGGESALFKVFAV